jgi:CRISPR-associated protein Cas1
MTRVVLDEFGQFLGRKGNRYIVKSNESKKEFYSSDIDQIFILNPGMLISVSALRLALNNHTFVIFGGQTGWPHGFLVPSGFSGSVLTKRQQFLAFHDFRGAFLAREFALGKTINQSNLLKQLSKNRLKKEQNMAEELDKASKEISKLVSEMEKIPVTNEGATKGLRSDIMNIEARASRIYWKTLSTTIFPKELKFPGRKGKGASDPINMMLNFGYKVILFVECWKAVYYSGLDPFAGYLHADRPSKASLALDLMEEFRQQVVDRAIFSILTKRMLYFNEMSQRGDDHNSNRLSKYAIKVVFEQIINRLNAEVVTHDDHLPSMKLKNVIQRQAVNLASYLTDPSRTFSSFRILW